MTKAITQTQERTKKKGVRSAQVPKIATSAIGVGNAVYLCAMSIARNRFFVPTVHSEASRRQNTNTHIHVCIYAFVRTSHSFP